MAQSCTYDGKAYSHGSVVCQAGYEYRCNDGIWDALNTKCDPTDAEVSRGAGSDSESDEVPAEKP